MKQQTRPTHRALTHATLSRRRSDVERLDRQLRLLRSTLEVWLDVQRSWMVLEPVFTAPDIQRQLPAEARAFAQVRPRLMLSADAGAFV